MAVVLGLGRSQPVGRLVNDKLGPGPGPGNEVPLPIGPFRGYLFENPSTIIAAIWMADAEYGTVGLLTLSRLSKLQLQSVTVYNTFGNTLATRLTNSGLEFLMGRDVATLCFQLQTQHKSMTRSPLCSTPFPRLVAPAAGHVVLVNS